MAKIIKNSAGKVLVSNDTVLKVDATIDPNIVAGNIKKDVTILGVTGTYEGSGGSSKVIYEEGEVHTGSYINNEECWGVVANAYALGKDFAIRFEKLYVDGDMFENVNCTLVGFDDSTPPNGAYICNAIVPSYFIYVSITEEEISISCL